MNPSHVNFLLILLFLTLNTSTTNAATHKTTYARQFLSIQNAARSDLGLAPLTWDPRIARYAAWYANVRRADCALEHSNGPYGENIFWGNGDEGRRLRRPRSGWRRRRATTIAPIHVPMGSNVGIILRLCGRRLEELGVQEWCVMRVGVCS
ncbi:UNVERIFIED_CONTAM: Pathogenesis-related protein PR-1 [Sesamum radiatum]|uniref:Pathogenesis-related protein PR-1 n=1 Tax=Sesamum radiatum TaxID=300843 RepID=A0AAW2LBW6_SESRA